MVTIIVLWILLSIIALIVVLLHFSVSAYIKADENGFTVKVNYFFFTLYPRKPKKQKLKKKKVLKGDRKKKEKEFSDNLDDELGEQFSIDNENDSDDNLTYSVISDVVSEESTFSNEQSFEQFNEKNSKPDKEENKQQKVLKKEPEKIKQKKSKKNKDEKNSKLSYLKDKYNKIKPYLPMSWKYFKKLLKTIRITDVKIEVEVGREDAHEAAIYYGVIQGALFNALGQICNMFSVKIKKANVNCIFIKNTINGSAECYVKIRPSAVIAIAFCIGVNFLIIFLRQRRKNNDKQENEIENKDENILEVK
ncbi:MAG: hypothetical protein K2F81_05465 [Ruminococcus sp.]|nr:hypothetical protein [Ruminococcus sp.]